jgi:hypothetical protein
MVNLNTAVTTKLTFDDYQLLKRIAQEEYDRGKLREPNVSRLIRLWIRGKMRKWQEANSPVDVADDIILHERGSCYYTSQ